MAKSISPKNLARPGKGQNPPKPITRAGHMTLKFGKSTMPKSGKRK